MSESLDKVWAHLAPIACWHIRCLNRKINGSNYCIRHTFGEDLELPEPERGMKVRYNEAMIHLTVPSDPQVNDNWYNTETGKNYKYDGQVWREILTEIGNVGEEQ